ncbi:MAG: hypothetical protein MZV64_43885 [Ignavibacteriales bacterium]|nr:hypothetical protein [Ignavibacteriales bacterium]
MPPKRPFALAVVRGDRVRVRRLRVEELDDDGVLLVEPEEAVGPGDVVAVVVPHPPRVEDAERRHPADVLAEPEDAARGRLVERALHRALVRREDEVGHLVLGGEEAHGRAAGFAGQLGAPERVGDRPGEDGLERRQEEVRPLEEEGPLLGVEQGEAPVDRRAGRRRPRPARNRD